MGGKYRVPGRAICKQCGIEKVKIRTHADPKANRYTYRDVAGVVWHGRLCPQCRIAIQELRSRKLGIKPRDLITEPMNRKGRQAERIAARHFENLGYLVTLTRSMGPDLILQKGAEVF
jgi:hypothetical protein